MSEYCITFPNSEFSDVRVPAGTRLSTALDATNSPVLFGCRTGLCGTCAMVVRGELSGVTPEETETLEVTVDDTEGVRLMCLIRVQSDLSIESMESIEGLS